MVKRKSTVKFQKKDLLILLLVVIALYVLLPQLNDFKSSWHYLSKPEAKYVWAASFLSIITYFCAASTYYYLSFKPLVYLQAFIVEWAAMFMNRLLPGGLGALGANYQFLRHKGNKAVQAGSIVAINNILGLIGHLLLLISAILIFHHDEILPKIIVSHQTKLIITWITSVAFLLACLLIFFAREKFKKISASFLSELSGYRKKPEKIYYALIAQILLSLSNFLCILYSADAVGIHLSYVDIVIIFSLGVGARAVTPTPGGLGGFEAGLVAGMIAYKVQASEALAAVLLFRIITYWAPLAVGGLCFFYSDKKGWFRA
jgi:uncharacterized protein (TIRG00374 family)